MARVLLIDDDHDRTENLAEGLRAEGMEVTVVSSRHEVFKKLEMAPFDCAVVVVALPTGDRIELAGELRERYPSVCVVLASGHRLAIKPTGFEHERVFRFIPNPEDGRSLGKALRSRLDAA